MRSWVNAIQLPLGGKRTQREFSLWKVEPKQVYGVDAMCWCLISDGWIEASTLALLPSSHELPEVWKRLYSLTVGMLEWEGPWGLSGRVTLKPCLVPPWSCNTCGWHRTHCGGLLGGLATLSFRICIVWSMHTYTRTCVCKEGGWGWVACLPRHFEIFPPGQQISVSTRLWPGNNSYVYTVFIELMTCQALNKNYII